MATTLCGYCYVSSAKFVHILQFYVAQVIGNSLSFAMGLATTLALLGVAASFAGKAYGQIGQGLPVAASSLAIIMGLNLLEVLLFFNLLLFVTFYIAVNFTRQI